MRSKNVNNANHNKMVNMKIKCLFQLNNTNSHQNRSKISINLIDKKIIIIQFHIQFPIPSSMCHNQFILTYLNIKILRIEILLDICLNIQIHIMLFSINFQKLTKLQIDQYTITNLHSYQFNSVKKFLCKK